MSGAPALEPSQSPEHLHGPAWNITLQGTDEVYNNGWLRQLVNTSRPRHQEQKESQHRGHQSWGWGRFHTEKL